MCADSRRAIAAWVVVTMFGATGCALAEPTAPPANPLGSPSPSAQRAERVLSLDFDDLAKLVGTRGINTGALPLTNTGSEPLTVRVSSVAGGTLKSMPGRKGGYAARFPVFLPRTRERLVVMLTSSSVTDPLGPGSSDFAFGADFAVDTVSDGNRLDNGNNLIQRGLTGSPAQYKLQIDGGRVSCLVAGDAGEVIVKSKHTILPHTWYRISCSRSGDAITLVLGAVGAPPESTVESGRTGAVYVTAKTPLVLGGKATPAGDAVVGDSDQFNGAMDNVFLDIGQDS